MVLQDDGNLVLYSASNNPLWASNTVEDWDPFTTDTGDNHLDTGQWMHTWASMASSGLISGHTHIWTTNEVSGFHGSAVAVLLDSAKKVVWPPNPQVTKHQYGVDGTWIAGLPSSRTEYWADQADTNVLGAAESLACINFLDPRNMLLSDFDILGKIVDDVGAGIKALAG